MPHSQDTEPNPAALDKAQEGMHLLSAGDYEGAVAACTQAMELDHRSLGAYRTRAEAYRLLGRRNWAEADLRYIAGHAVAPYEVFDEGPPLDSVLAWGLLGGGGLGIVAPWVTDVTLWWPTMLGIIGLFLGLHGTVTERLTPAKTVALAGTVTGKRVEGWGDYFDYYIRVSRIEFKVSRSLYDAVSGGDKVVLTVKGMRGAGEVVENLGSS